MERAVFETQDRLKIFPPAQFIYIIYRRLVEQGIHTTYLWVMDKTQQRLTGFSPPALSRIQPLLYVGGQPRRHGLQRMRALNIHAIVNLRKESDDVRRGVALEHYLWLPTTDDAPPTLEDLEKGRAFITEQITAGRGVYIHCAAGVGRAPTMAVAYLVSTGLTAKHAWDMISQVRPFIRPTPKQIEVIEAFVLFLSERQGAKL